MLKELTTIANEMDRRGLTKEADELDSIIRSYAAWDPTKARDEHLKKTKENTTAIFSKLKDAFNNLDINTVASQMNLTPRDIEVLKGIQKGKALNNTSLNFGGDSCHATEHVNSITCAEKYLLAFRSNDDIASVIGHEIAHLVFLHTSRMDLDSEAPLGEYSFQAGQGGDQAIIQGPKAEEFKDNIQNEKTTHPALKPGTDLYKTLKEKGNTETPIVDTITLRQGNEDAADKLGCLIAMKAGFNCSTPQFLKSFYGQNRHERERDKATKDKRVSESRGHYGDHLDEDIRIKNQQLWLKKLKQQYHQQ